MATARGVAVEALTRVDGGAYANVVLPALLGRSRLDRRDRAFATELVYGVCRRRRACDWLIDRFVSGPLDATVRAVLRVGTYQLAFLHTPAHAAVSATVGIAPRRARGLVNAVLRRVASAPKDWPNEGTRLSYPDWIIDRLKVDLGVDQALDALDAMNEPASVTTRADGYVQDLASQWVATLVGARAGERVADLCAAPGGKATLMAGLGPFVIAGDRRPARAGLVASNVASLGLTNVATVVADGRHPPLRAGSVERVLIDAPCSGLGVLRRRPDARWRIRPEDVVDLADLQRALLGAGSALLVPGGTLVYSVCTMTAAETADIDRWLAGAHPELEARTAPARPWVGRGRGAQLLPQTIGTDGMFVLILRRRP